MYELFAVNYFMCAEWSRYHQANLSLSLSFATHSGINVIYTVLKKID